MKHSFILIAIIGALMILLGCTENQPTSPYLEQTENTSNILSKKLVSFGPNAKYFTGVCTKTTDPDFVESPGTMKALPNGKMLVKDRTTVWHDATNDPRTTGNTYWFVEQKIEEDGTWKYWGKAILVVENDGGSWEVSWHGYLDGNGLIAYGTGQGKEGGVKGLVGKWKYTFDFGQFQYDIEGYVNK